MKRIVLVIFSISLQFAIYAQGFTWAKSFGSKYDDHVWGMALDKDGNTYTICDFGEGADIYIQKIDGEGNFIWQKELINYDISLTSYECRAYSIVADNDGNIYLTGRFKGTVDFDPGADTFTLTSTGLSCFVLKLDTAGKFVWVKSIAGSTGQGISYHDNNIHIVGFFRDTIDFDPGVGVYNLNAGSLQGADGFILKLDTAGNFKWAVNISSDDFIDARKIVVDDAGSAYIVGVFDGTADFDPGPGVYNLNGDEYVLKLDSAGKFLWAKPNYYWFAPVLDKQANVYLYGQGSKVCKLDPAGNTIWAKTMPTGGALSVDNSNNIFMTGSFRGNIDFEPASGKYKFTSKGFYDDCFILKTDSNGNIIWVKVISGEYSELPYTIQTDGQGNAYVCGIFSDTVNFDPNTGSYYLHSPSSVDDIFVMKIAYNNVGIEGREKKNENIISPNPAKDKLYINNAGKIEKLTIVNAQGQLMQAIEKPSSETDISVLPVGLYFLQIEMEEGKFVHKFLKE